MSLFGSMIGSAISSAVNTAVKTAAAVKKNTGGSSKGGSTAANTKNPAGTRYGDITNAGGGTISQTLYDQYDAIAKNAAAQWHNAKTDADKAAWHKIAIDANTALGRSYNDSTGTWSGGKAPVQESPYLPQQNQNAQQDAQTQSPSQKGWDNFENSAVYKAYQTQIEKQNAATQAAIAQGKLNLQQQLPGIRQSYDDVARQAYINYMNARKELPQQLAAAGVGGQGVAESTLSAQSNQYSNVLSQSEMARQNAEQQIKNNVANLEATGDLQYAQNAANINQSALSAYENYLAQQQAQLNADRDFTLQLGAQTGFISGMPTMDWQQMQNNINADSASANASQQAQAYERQMQKLQNALMFWKQNGYADEGVASALKEFGFTVPVGAGTSGQRYQDAKLALDKYLAYRQT